MQTKDYGSLNQRLQVYQTAYKFKVELWIKSAQLMPSLQWRVFFSKDSPKILKRGSEDIDIAIRLDCEKIESKKETATWALKEYLLNILDQYYPLQGKEDATKDYYLKHSPPEMLHNLCQKKENNCEFQIDGRSAGKTTAKGRVSIAGAPADEFTEPCIPNYDTAKINLSLKLLGVLAQRGIPQAAEFLHYYHEDRGFHLNTMTSSSTYILPQTSQISTTAQTAPAPRQTIVAPPVVSAYYAPAPAASAVVAPASSSITTVGYYKGQKLFATKADTAVYKGHENTEEVLTTEIFNDKYCSESEMELYDLLTDMYGQAVDIYFGMSVDGTIQGIAATEDAIYDLSEKLKKRLHKACYGANMKISNTPLNFHVHPISFLNTSNNTADIASSARVTSSSEDAPESTSSPTTTSSSSSSIPPTSTSSVVLAGLPTKPTATIPGEWEAYIAALEERVFALHQQVHSIRQQASSVPAPAPVQAVVSPTIPVPREASPWTPPTPDMKLFLLHFHCPSPV